MKFCQWNDPDQCLAIVKHARSRYCPRHRGAAKERAQDAQRQRMVRHGAKLRAALAKCDSVTDFLVAAKAQRKQAWLAKRLDIHRNTVWQWCNGRSKPGPRSWRDIAALAGSRQRTVKL